MNYYHKHTNLPIKMLVNIGKEGWYGYHKYYFDMDGYNQSVFSHFHRSGSKNTCPDDRRLGSVYRTLSFAAHPNIINYSSRYFETDSSENTNIYNSSPKANGEESMRRLILLSDVLIGSTKRVHEILPNCNILLIKTQLEKFSRQVVEAGKN